MRQETIKRMKARAAATLTGAKTAAATISFTRSGRIVITLIAALLMAMATQTAWAQSRFTDDNGDIWDYTYDSGNNVTTLDQYVGGSGRTDVTTPAAIKGHHVTVIGDYCFTRNTTLENLTISDGVVSIGIRAFYGSNLASVSLPGSVRSIGNDAFSDCFSLTGIAIPDGVEVISDGAFSGCI